MKLRTILYQAAPLSQDNSVTLMDKLSLNAAFSQALWILREPMDPLCPVKIGEVELAKQHC